MSGIVTRLNYFFNYIPEKRGKININGHDQELARKGYFNDHFI